MGIWQASMQLSDDTTLFIRETYEEIIQVFPSNGRFWKAYIEHEMKMRNYEKVEKLFQRCLIKEHWSRNLFGLKNRTYC